MDKFEANSVLVNRHVNDMILVSRTEPVLATAANFFFRNVGQKLGLTEELPPAGEPENADVILSLNSGLGWPYGKPNAKPVLSVGSCHSKLVKSGLMNSLLKNALLKLCLHHAVSALQNQMVRFLNACRVVS